MLISNKLINRFMISLVAIRLSMYFFHFIACSALIEQLETAKLIYDVAITINRVEVYENEKTYLYFTVNSASCNYGYLMKTMHGVIKISGNEYKKILNLYHEKTLLYLQCDIKGQFEKNKVQSNPGQINPKLQQLSYRSIGTFQGTFNGDQIHSVSKREILFRKISLELFNIKEKMIHWILQRLAQLYTQPTLGIVIAMILGSRDTVSSDILSLYKEQGIIHIIAISGLHIGFLYIALEICFKVCFMSKKMRLWVCGSVLIIYNYLLGFNISALRASWMVFLYYFAIAYEKPYSNKMNLFSVGMVFLFIYPQSLFHCGFLLSYGAVIGLFYIQPKLKYVGRLFNLKSSIPKYSNILLLQILNLISVSIAVNIMTLPIVLFYFGGVSLTSILANVLIVPIILLFYFMILASLILGNAIVLVSNMASGLVVIINYYIVLICRILDMLPMNYILLQRPNFFEIGLYYSLVLICMNQISVKGAQDDSF